MPDEGKKCCCCGEKSPDIIDGPGAVDKMQRRNLVSAVILLILAAVLAVWHFWGREYAEECRYKSALLEEMDRNGINYSDITVKDGQYTVTLGNGAKMVYTVDIDRETNTYEFVVTGKSIPGR